MTRFSHLLFLMSTLCSCARTAPSSQPVTSCASPIPDRFWGEAIKDSVGANGRSSFSHFPTSPRIDSAMVSGLEGHFDFIVVSTNPRSARDSIVRGQLTLTLAPAKYRDSPNPAVQARYVGHTDIALQRLGHVSMAYSPSSRDRKRPGVEVVYDSQHGTLSMSLGNAYSTGENIMDAGVSFDIFRVDSTGLTGRWLDGGLPVAEPNHVTQGYFCAVRAST